MRGIKINIKDFKEKDKLKQLKMEEELSKFKLEDIKSLWYFIVAGSKAWIMGSKG